MVRSPHIERWQVLQPASPPIPALATLHVNKMYDRKWWPIVPHCFLALNEGTKWWPTFDSKTVFYHKISLVAFFQCMNQRTWCSPGHCCHTITGHFTLFSSGHYHVGRIWVRDRASIPGNRQWYYSVHTWCLLWRTYHVQYFMSNVLSVVPSCLTISEVVVLSWPPIRMVPSGSTLQDTWPNLHSW